LRRCGRRRPRGARVRRRLEGRGVAADAVARVPRGPRSDRGAARGGGRARRHRRTGHDRLCDRVPSRGPAPVEQPQQDRPRPRRALRAPLKSSVYGRWDGTQDEFRLDAERALDALSNLMMEGLDAREALEWMRQHGFELAGLDMRVMGLSELIE